MESSPKRRKPGQRAHSLLTPELAKKFCEHLKAGATEKGAAAAVGWSYATYFEWMQRGLGTDPDRPTTPELAEFARAVLEARGAARVMTEVSVRKQHPLPWLYNRYSEDWRPIAPRNSAEENDESISLSAARKILDEYLESDTSNGKGNSNGKH